MHLYNGNIHLLAKVNIVRPRLDEQASLMCRCRFHGASFHFWTVGSRKVGEARRVLLTFVSLTR